MLPDRRQVRYLPRAEGGGTTSFSIALMCTTGHRIQASAGTNQGPVCDSMPQDRRQVCYTSVNFRATEDQVGGRKYEARGRK
jgi:hypothetical protein